LHELDVERKLLVCLGFGIDHYHSVCHAHFLEAVAELKRRGGYLGTVSLVADIPEVRRSCIALRCSRPARTWTSTMPSLSLGCAARAIRAPVAIPF
jgi:hypothetical protein